MMSVAMRQMDGSQIDEIIREIRSAESHADLLRQTLTEQCMYFGITTDGEKRLRGHLCSIALLPDGQVKIETHSIPRPELHSGSLSSSWARR